MAKRGAPVRLWLTRNQFDWRVIMARGANGAEWVERVLGDQPVDPHTLDRELREEYGVGLWGLKSAEEHVLNSLVDRMNQLEARRKTKLPFTTPKAGFLGGERLKDEQ